MQIAVKNLKGDILSMQTENSDTIENIKIKLKEQYNIEHDQISLTINEKYPTTDLSVFLDLSNTTIEKLNTQINSLVNQTLMPKIIYGCFFGNINKEIIDAYNVWNKIYPNIVYINSNNNLSCLSLYYLSLNASTKYVMIMDNDRIPNKDFIKKNVEILDKKQDCVIGQYGWILNEKKADYNGLFIFPDDDNLSFINKHFDLSTYELSDSILEQTEIDKYVKFSDNSKTLLNVDYLCGCLCFKKSLLHKIFDKNINIDIGEEIFFCLTLKNKDIPIYCFTSNEDERLLLEDKDSISTTCETITKRTKIIRDIL